jgi:hypothetical protein
MIGLCHSCFASNVELHLDKKSQPECERCRK